MGLSLPPLCILQARYHSTRLPGKMLLTLGDETLIARGWRIACEAFDRAHCVVAIPATDEPGPLGDELRRLGATIFAWDGPEDDVLSRFYHCAHRYRWHPDSIIVRYTPDDPFKDMPSLRRVAAGWRLPVEQGGEAFTLAMLDAAYHDSKGREHLTYALFPTASPHPPPGIWTIDTAEDLAAARWLVGEEP